MSAQNRGRRAFATTDATQLMLVSQEQDASLSSSLGRALWVLLMILFLPTQTQNHQITLSQMRRGSQQLVVVARPSSHVQPQKDTLVHARVGTRQRGASCSQVTTRNRRAVCLHVLWWSFAPTFLLFFPYIYSLLAGSLSRAVCCSRQRRTCTRPPLTFISCRPPLAAAAPAAAVAPSWGTPSCSLLPLQHCHGSVGDVYQEGACDSCLCVQALERSKCRSVALTTPESEFKQQIIRHYPKDTVVTPN